jgi:hypothetical protein
LEISDVVELVDVCDRGLGVAVTSWSLDFLPSTGFPPLEWFQRS